MPNNAKPMIFKITGLDCAEEVSILKREVGPLVGGAEFLAFDVLNAKMIVTSKGIVASSIIETIKKTGMSAVLEGADATAKLTQPVGWWQENGRLALTIASGIFTASAFFTHVSIAGSWSGAVGSEGMSLSQPVPLLVRVLYAVAIVAGVYFVLPKAIFAVRKMRPDMNLLMVIAVCGAVLIGEWFESATVSFLFALSLTLESWSVGRARRAIEKLLDLAPAMVRLISFDQSVAEVPAAGVAAGSRFQVRPGERIPLDGDVVAGLSDVNQAPITGESVAVVKEPGSFVYAGTINGAGALEILSTKAAGDTTLANIIRLVGEAQTKRAPSEQWVDRFAYYYTPAVMLLSMFVLVIPTVFLGQPFQVWLYQALVLLVIACPCALVVSTPVSVVAALAAAARQGVLVKGGLHLETAATLKAIALDKTGTLTKGRPAVVGLVALSGHTEIELLERAIALESHSDHPLAQAILEYGKARGVQPLAAEQFSIIPGKGATGTWNGKQYWLGSHRFLEERNQETPEVHAQLETLSREGKTVVVIGNKDHVCGFFALSDTVRPESRGVIDRLRASGVQHIVMLTGDNRGTAEAVGAQTGIFEVQAELLPTDKVLAIERLVERYKFVAMIGDGINDAPALSRSSLGIALAAAGSDTAMEAADVALMSDDLAKVPWLMEHSKRMISIIRTNIILSLLVKAVFVLLTLFGHSSLWAAIAADMGTSLLVIFNALRLLREPSP